MEAIQQKMLSPLHTTVSGRVITVSDRCYSGIREDHSGPLAQVLLSDYNIAVDRVVVIPDGIDAIRGALTDAIADGITVIITTGGTGVTPRDLTPEATEEFLAARLPGIEQLICAEGLKKTPLAPLSRGLVGVTSREARGSIIVNAPGSKGGVADTIAVIGPLIPHILEQLGGGDHPLEESTPAH